MRGIKSRLLVSHFIVIFLTVVVLETISFIGIRSYFYKSIEENLKKQAETYSSFHNKYFSRGDISKYSDDIVQNLTNSTNAEIQVVSTEGLIIMDSLGIEKETKMDYPDIKNVISTEKTSTWIGIPKYTREKCICVSYPIIDSAKNEPNVIRLVSSLKQVDNLLSNLIIIFIIVGICVIFSILIVSILISNSIINPLNDVIAVAKEMAEGKFSVRAVKKYDDEIGTLGDTLNYMAEEILKNEKLKNDFISSVSHELRTPLTSIKGWALTLKRKDFTDVQQREKGLDIIVDESERLSDMVEELLDFSRFQSNRITLNIEEVELSELLKDIVVQMKPRAVRNYIDLREQIEDISIVNGDRNRLKQVFINILDNSLKFTKNEGKINIQLTCNEAEAIVIIEDTGCGIKTEHLPNVLKKFYKGDLKKTGSGIGLAICDEIIRLHGGRLDIESKFGEGTKVIIYLRLLQKY